MSTSPSIKTQDTPTDVVPCPICGAVPAQAPRQIGLEELTKFLADDEKLAFATYRTIARAVLDTYSVSSTERCATCGLPESEHHYNGAAYGVCGDYTSVTRPERGGK